MVKEHLDYLLSRDMPASQMKSYANCVLRMREKFLRNMEMKKESVLDLEAESGGVAGELAELQEHVVKVIDELR